MQIIQKPKSHKLPFSLSRKMTVHSKISNLPKIDFSSLQKRKILCQTQKNKISYHFEIDQNNCRPIIRTALSKNLTFQIVKDRDKFTPQILISSFSEPMKTLAFKELRLQTILLYIKDIFGEDFLLKDRQLLAVEGKITKKYYIFFISPHYRPFSLCHRVPIFLKIANSDDLDFLNDTQQNCSEIQPFHNIQTKGLRIEFICSQCKKVVLKLAGNSKKNQASLPLKSRLKSKEQHDMNIQRKKINLSVMIASGKFRKHRLNQGSSILNRRYIENTNVGQSIELTPQVSKDYFDVLGSGRKKTLHQHQVD